MMLYIGDMLADTILTGITVLDQPDVRKALRCGGSEMIQFGIAGDGDRHLVHVRLRDAQQVFINLCSLRRATCRDDYHSQQAYSSEKSFFITFHFFLPRFQRSIW